MASCKSNTYIVVVKALEKTITAESHLGMLLDANILGPEYLIGENQTPMIRITYEELDLSGIEAAYRNKKELLALRNFLVGKKKGLDKSQWENAFALYWVTDAKNKESAVYYLKVEKSLLEKIETKDRSAISANIKICGLFQEPVLLKTGFGYEDRTFELCEEGNVFGVEKEQLQNLNGNKTKNITFYFTVSIECTPHWNSNWFNTGEPRSVLQSVYDLPDSTKDVAIVTASGAVIKAHKVILMAQSKVFFSMLNSENATAEAQSGRIKMEGNSEEGLVHLLHYLYGFKLMVDTLSPDVTLELFQLSHKYGLKELEADMKDLLIGKGLDWYSVDSLLELYFYVENNEDLEELRTHALTELSELPTNNALIESDYFKKMDHESQKKLLLTLWSWSRTKM